MISNGRAMQLEIINKIAILRRGGGDWTLLMLSVGAVQKFQGVLHYLGQQVTQVLLHGIQLLGC